jgi:hypothetical protein
MRLRLAHRGEARLVAPPLAVVGIDPGDELPHEIGRLALGEPVIGPRALGVPLDEAGVGQEFQMPRDARLALAENFRQVLDLMFPGGEKDKQAQPRRLAGGAQHLDPFSQT